MIPRSQIGAQKSPTRLNAESGQLTSSKFFGCQKAASKFRVEYGSVRLPTRAHGGPSLPRETQSGVNSPRRRAQTRRLAYLRWRILARIRRFLRPIFRRPLPVLFVPIPLAAFQIRVSQNMRTAKHTVARQIGQTSIPLIRRFSKG